MVDKVKKVSNPLTIVAIFAGLAEVASTVALGLINEEIQLIFIWFVMVFPVLLVVIFFLTLNLNPKVLYSPSDFKDEDNFLQTLAGSYTLKKQFDEMNNIITESKAEIISLAKEATKKPSEQNTEISTPTNGESSVSGVIEVSKKEDPSKSVESLINEKFSPIEEKIKDFKISTELLTMDNINSNTSSLQLQIINLLISRGALDAVTISNVLSITVKRALESLEKLRRRGLIDVNYYDDEKKYYVKMNSWTAS
ncbi:hypothetical protein BVG16_13700 [Paenibacillus selenitireducens]|uniref:Uncharacterized protein n=1 Tax=Paenibacillus selenitireducens TaxID=1324314 RepID=A0A1T2XCK1_9BACL|nr:hypothetical protein [Paenibacillus selenitireducens]OPA77502.1 hypothetical protein BVG16_13700 [Paenibacillus selenitireducens]